MPRNRSELQISLPPIPNLEGAPSFISALVRLDARDRTGLGESFEGDKAYHRLSEVDRMVYDCFDQDELVEHHVQWCNWYAAIEMLISKKIFEDAP